MASFYVTARKTTPLTPLTIEAETREGAAAQVVAEAEEGATVEILEIRELGPTEVAPPTGGVTGATGSAMLDAKPSRAQLNEMTKDELLAVADKEDVDVNSSYTKAEIVDAIVKHKRA